MPCWVYPAGGLQWPFACGFGFRHGVVICGPFVGLVGGGILIGLGVALSGLSGGLVVVSGIEGLAGAPRLLGFILLLGCSGALLVVSALDVVWDCHLRPVYRSCGVSGSFFAWDGPFQVVGGLVGYV